ncbi:MAG: hypothetical protein ACK56F_15190, partial [bacterium]
MCLESRTAADQGSVADLDRSRPDHERGEVETRTVSERSKSHAMPRRPNEAAESAVPPVEERWSTSLHHAADDVVAGTHAM